MWLLINLWHLGSFCDPNVGGFHGKWELQTRCGIILGSIQVQQCRDKGPMESFAEVLTRDKHLTCHGYLDQANGLPCADSRAEGWHHHDYSTALYCRQGRHLQPWRVSVQVCVSQVIRSSLKFRKESRVVRIFKISNSFKLNIWFETGSAIWDFQIICRLEKFAALDNSLT